jgi:hypothetical protein
MNIDQETGEAISQPRSPRFKLWVAFLVFSTITMGSAVGVKKTREEADSNAKWAVTCSATTFAVTGLVVLLHLSPSFSGFIVNTKTEGVLTFLLAAFWGATVAVVSNASSGLAVNSALDNTIVNGNLYYFSCKSAVVENEQCLLLWCRLSLTRLLHTSTPGAGFVTSIMLVVAYLRGVFGVDLAGEIKNRAARLTIWSALLACQLVVMGASANAFDKGCAAQVNSFAYCRRTKYGIALGAIGTIFSLAVVGMKMITSIAPFVVEGALAFILCIMNGFGVAFLTSAQGPGSPIGNLYYFTWLSFLCNFMLVASVYEDYQNIGGSPEKKEDGVDVETIEAL